MNYYPAFLNLRGKKAVIIGGGRVAERKILMLVKAGAAVTVISPTLTQKLLKEKERQTIRHIARNYRSSDLNGSFLVIAATSDAMVNSKVASDAPSLVNVVDMPQECTFIAPSVIQRGPLTIAISTGGASPALSKAMRRELEQMYGPDFGAYLQFLSSLRKQALDQIGDRKKRERFLKSLASEKTLRLLRRKGMQAVMKAAERQFAALQTSC